MFKGTYKYYDAKGGRVVYEREDSVEYQGKLYECVNRTAESPIQNPSAWKYANVMAAFYGALPPADPKDGQFWTDPNGVTYKWFRGEGAAYAWVEA